MSSLLLWLLLMSIAVVVVASWVHAGRQMRREIAAAQQPATVEPTDPTKAYLAALDAQLALTTHKEVLKTLSPEIARAFRPDGQPCKVEPSGAHDWEERSRIENFAGTVRAWYTCERCDVSTTDEALVREQRRERFRTDEAYRKRAVQNVVVSGGSWAELAGNVHSESFGGAQIVYGNRRQEEMRAWQEVARRHLNQ